ncbi:hypothetical protein [Streptomyces sp. NRRL B-1347]|uniref:hypothetical protein n=1 Tax=Streptomyces sp. NRRL B-1347 TaxID=1476877 RepID=UPI0004C9E125|nr:hypothetical protein [Streptomyces sp. NRRL B-1347]
MSPRALRKQRGDGNPSVVPTETPAVPFDTAFREFRRIGEESVPALLRARDPRRAAVRLGLLAWPALQPSGNRWKASLARGVMWVLKPFVWLPAVLVLDENPGHVTSDVTEVTRQLIVGGTMLAAASALLWAGVQGRGHALWLPLVAVAAGGAGFLLQAWADGRGDWPVVLILFTVLTTVSVTFNWLRPKAKS